MIEIAFLACLSATPATCEDRAIQLADVSAMACVTGAQPELARWANEHPGWQVRRWTCRSVEATGRST
jgi:hypothetical protein